MPLEQLHASLKLIPYTLTADSICIEIDMASSLRVRLDDFRLWFDIFENVKLDDELFFEIDTCSELVSGILNFTIDCNSFRESGLEVYIDWSDFLSTRVNQSRAPEEFLILDTNEYVSELGNSIANLSKTAVHYRQVLKVAALLERCSDYVEFRATIIPEKFVFLHKSRIDVLYSLGVDELSETLDGISVISGKFDDEAHMDQKISIFKETLYSLLSSSGESIKLKFLLENFGEFSKRFADNYDYFVSGFSFDDVRVEYEEKKRDYLARLNDIYSSSLMKMIGIPISLALMSFKMTAILDNVTFFTNFMLLLAVIIYGFMMVTLIKNQKHTLTALKTEYTAQMDRLKFRFSDQYELIKEVVEELDDRGDFQRACLNWYYVAVSVLILFVGGLFLFNLPWVKIML